MIKRISLSLTFLIPPTHAIEILNIDRDDRLIRAGVSYTSADSEFNYSGGQLTQSLSEDFSRKERSLHITALIERKFEFGILVDNEQIDDTGEDYNNRSITFGGGLYIDKESEKVSLISATRTVNDEDGIRDDYSLDLSFGGYKDKLGYEFTFSSTVYDDEFGVKGGDIYGVSGSASYAIDSTLYGFGSLGLGFLTNRTYDSGIKHKGGSISFLAFGLGADITEAISAYASFSNTSLEYSVNTSNDIKLYNSEADLTAFNIGLAVTY